MEKRIAIIIGHNKNAQGATAYNGQSEYKFNTNVAKEMYSYCEKNYLDIKLFIITRDDGDITGAAKKVNELLPIDLTLEIHLNDASGDPRGCEILVNKGDKDFINSVMFADKVTDWLSYEFGIVERRVTMLSSKKADGVFSVADKDRGAWNLKAMDLAGAAMSLLIEPCFCGKKTVESEKIIENPIRYAHFLVDSIARYWEIKKVVA